MLEVYEVNLEQIIEMLKKEDRIFQEEELWTIARQIITALKYLKRKGFPHGKLTSKMIIFKDEQYKISPV